MLQVIGLLFVIYGAGGPGQGHVGAGGPGQGQLRIEQVPFADLTSCTNGMAAIKTALGVPSGAAQTGANAAGAPSIVTVCVPQTGAAGNQGGNHTGNQTGNQPGHHTGNQTGNQNQPNG